MQAYMSNSEIIYYTNNKRFDHKFFNSSKYINESVTNFVTFSSKQPVWQINSLRKLVLHDQTSVFQSGEPEPLDYWRYKFGSLSPSGYDNYPSEYIIYGGGFFIDSTIDTVNRKTNSLLTALGSIGGSAWAMLFVFNLIVIGFAVQHTTIVYVTELFKRSLGKNPSDRGEIKNMTPKEIEETLV